MTEPKIFKINRKITVEETHVINCYEFYRLIREKYPKLSAGDFANKFLSAKIYGQRISLSAYVNTPWGKRILFYCPRCSKPAVNLYQVYTDGPYACLRCHDLTYSSRQIEGSIPAIEDLYRKTRLYFKIYRIGCKKIVQWQKNHYKHLHKKIKEKEANNKMWEVIHRVMNQ